MYIYPTRGGAPADVGPPILYILAIIYLYGKYYTASTYLAYIPIRPAYTIPYLPYTCHCLYYIILTSEIDVGLFLVVLLAQEGKYLFHRIG